MAKIKLLVIDNQTSVRGALRSYFERRGYEVAEAASGDEAVRQFQKFRPDALAVDCHLPDEDGNRLMAQVQSVLPDVPVIMASSYPSIGRALQSINLGASPDTADADLPLAEIEKRHIQKVLRNS